MLKLVLQIAAGLAFLCATPFLGLAWALAIPGMGSPRGAMLAILIGIPIFWCLTAAALLYWYGVPGKFVLGGLATITAYYAITFVGSLVP